MQGREAGARKGLLGGGAPALEALSSVGAVPVQEAEVYAGRRPAPITPATREGRVRNDLKARRGGLAGATWPPSKARPCPAAPPKTRAHEGGVGVVEPADAGARIWEVVVAVTDVAALRGEPPVAPSP